jgi:hypothetical protein
MKAKRRIFALLITSVIAVTLNCFVVKANAGGEWAPDARVPGYLDDTFTPFLVTDQNRTVHAFASQWVESMYRRRAIVYRQWTLKGGWTRPVDIILAPAGDATFLSAYLDSSSILHVIFMAGESNNLGVYYSHAAATEADWAPGWSEPILIGENALGVNSSSIVSDPQGNLFVIYSGWQEGNGVYLVSCADPCGNWSEPSPIFLTYDATLMPSSLKLVMAMDNQIRATWTVITSRGVDQALYFANYIVENSEWTTPIELDHRMDVPEYWGPSFPAMVDNGTDIIILYNGGNPYIDQFVIQGRPVMRTSISSDGGLTWRGPTNPFPFLNGRSGEHALAMDSMGRAHGLFIMRIDQLVKGEYRPIGGIWHSTYMNGIWSNPDRMVTSINPHDIRAVVVQGQILFVVWRQDPGDGTNGIWFSYAMLDSPELPIAPLSTVPAAISARESSTASSAPNTASPSPQNNIMSDSPSAQWMNNPAFPIIVGTIPVLLLVVGVVIVYRLLNDRRE